ncbi:MAG TPA: flagellar basal-body rod protein FlgF [Smithellaceae bacterium]|mgnify:CR=1 FL=1|nr:flagellar basal-body rod protein FlgF [Smithellaceae bacterium]
MRYDVTDVALAGARKLTQLDFVANNLANASTTGFKSEHLYYAMTGRSAQEGASLELGPTSTKIDFAQGTLMVTGNTFDLGIEGEGFFTIRTPQGPAYTRNGSFMLNARRELVTAAGDQVMGETGPIVVEGDNVQIGADGTIYADENPVGKIRITVFANPHLLTRSSSGRFLDQAQAGGRAASDYRIAGGYLEMSNVNSVKEMVSMMEIQRAFETYQKIILTITDMDKISTGRIGKLI